MAKFLSVCFFTAVEALLHIEIIRVCNLTSPWISGELMASYKRFIRLLEKWPVDKSKGER